MNRRDLILALVGAPLAPLAVTTTQKPDYAAAFARKLDTKWARAQQWYIKHRVDSAPIAIREVTADSAQAMQDGVRAWAIHVFGPTPRLDLDFPAGSYVFLYNHGHIGACAGSWTVQPYGVFQD